MGVVFTATFAIATASASGTLAAPDALAEGATRSTSSSSAAARLPGRAPLGVVAVVAATARVALGL